MQDFKGKKGIVGYEFQALEEVVTDGTIAAFLGFATFGSKESWLNQPSPPPSAGGVGVPNGPPSLTNANAFPQELPGVSITNRNETYETPMKPVK